MTKSRKMNIIETANRIRYEHAVTAKLSVLSFGVIASDIKDPSAWTSCRQYTSDVRLTLRRLAFTSARRLKRLH
jgi:hypothetical protein